ncbi:unnamed protein product [Schistocephalus solidus]|uniref:Na_H_Exchanger domain-containing protein n=1 Tax=Schistocephalus solidus TaxID=70667 RepID=A0A183TET9_SCHSO|nr:unnamed protein product [Schistocephalus solidus]
MILAIAAENTNLHRRIAVAFMRCMGQDACLLILSMMLPTWFLSMWMSNTATTVMMITIVEALLTKLDDTVEANSGEAAIEEALGAFFKCGRWKRQERPMQNQAEFVKEATSANSTEKLQDLEHKSDQEEEDDEIPLDIVVIVNKIAAEERRVLGPMK